MRKLRVDLIGAVVFVAFLLYAIAVEVQPHVGIIGFLTANGISEDIIAGLFIAGGLFMLVDTSNPPRRFLYLTPLMLYIVAGVFYIVLQPQAVVASVVGHGLAWVLIVIELYRKATGS